MSEEQHRRDLVLSFGARPDAVGLEFGPLNRPIARRPEFDVRYVDVFDTTGIRDHYREDPGVIVDDIPEVDFPLRAPDGRIRSLAEAVARDAPYSWAIASHVIEHVPDPIGWLADVAEVLDDDGSLILVVPDQRYSFDRMRPLTTAGQMLQAHRDGDVVPSVRAVFDHFRSVVGGTSSEFWAGRGSSTRDRLWALPATLDQVAAAERGEYIDCHVWVFTPDSFLEQMAELGRLGLSDLVAERAAPTPPDGLEFYVRLVRIPRGATEAEKTERHARAVEHLDDRVPGTRSPASEVPPSDLADRPRYLWVSHREARLIERKRVLLARPAASIARLRSAADGSSSARSRRSALFRIGRRVGRLLGSRPRPGASPD